MIVLCQISSSKLTKKQKLLRNLFRFILYGLNLLYLNLQVQCNPFLIQNETNTYHYLW